MHKVQLNQLELTLAIQPRGPLLIKSGGEGMADPSVPDMAFVRTGAPGGGPSTVYLPGSSLKGVIRSHCERIARTLGVPCCNPLDPKSSCHQAIGEEEGAQRQSKTYQHVCPLCRTFGSTQIASRVRFADAFPEPGTVKTETRTSVGIDRLTGGSKGGALFQFEAITDGRFLAEIRLHNYQLWQAGLLALALRDLDADRLQLGYGTSRGMGHVRALIVEAWVTYLGLAEGNGAVKGLRTRGGHRALLKDEGTIFYGLGGLLDPTERAAYGLGDDQIELSRLVPAQADGLYVSQRLRAVDGSVDPEVLDEFLAACVGGWVIFVEHGEQIEEEEGNDG
jgi:CRISPR-associated protein Csm3